MNVDFIHFSVNMDTYINQPDGVDTDDNVWFGVGFGNGDPFNVTIYHEMYNEWSIVGSMYF